MPKRRGGPEPGEIRDVLDDEPPVAHVQRRRHDVAAQVSQLSPVEKRDPGNDHRQHDDEGRKQPAGAPNPEVGQAEAPGLAPVLEEQVGDQITAQGEKHPDAEQASLGPSHIEVVDDHGQDRDCPQPVEAGDISMSCFGWSRQSTTRGTVPGLLRRGPDWDDGDHR